MSILLLYGVAVAATYAHVYDSVRDNKDSIISPLVDSSTIVEDRKVHRG